MFNQDPHEAFREHLDSFNFGAALRQFVSDNITLCLLILSVSAIAAVSGGAEKLLTHRRVGSFLLVVMVCRAFHSGATANRRIVMKDIRKEEESHDPEQDS